VPLRHCGEATSYKLGLTASQVVRLIGLFNDKLLVFTSQKIVHDMHDK